MRSRGSNKGEKNGDSHPTQNPYSVPKSDSLFTFFLSFNISDMSKEEELKFNFEAMKLLPEESGIFMKFSRDNMPLENNTFLYSEFTLKVGYITE